jgi:phosphoglycolate phosphatase-like HAD superfamily hydrolase
MSIRFKDYSTIVFDCDGVVLDSNKVKTDAFYQTALPYGEFAAQTIVDYHLTRGGVSRYNKFSYFLEHLLPDHTTSAHGPSLEDLLQAFAGHVRQGLLKCEIASGLQLLRYKTPGVHWLIASGGDQNELRDVFSRRGLSEWFDRGIFGSPATKEEILSREVQAGNITKPALLLGDSKYDYQAAKSADLDFVFLSGWSEVKDWHAWTSANNITHFTSLLEVAHAL